MNLSRSLQIDTEEQTPKHKAEVVPLFDPSLDQALENLNRITGLQFESYPQSLVNRDSAES